MGKELQNARPRRNIPVQRDRLQSSVLVWLMVPLLVFGALYSPIHAVRPGAAVGEWVLPLLLSLGLAALAFALKTATLQASGIGFLVCMIISQPMPERSYMLPHTALPALATLFLLTAAATRFGRSRKEARRLAEGRRGRRASQVTANLGVAALCISLGWYSGCIAALAEAAADTASSEIGQSIGGPAWLVTTWRRVAVGTDGGVSLAGSMAGIGAAALVVIVGMVGKTSWPDAIIVFAASCLGLVFDSLLGATVERRGWLGNDLVNFSSTLFAAGLVVVWFAIRSRFGL